MDLIASRRMTYGTRRLLPGDPFTAPDGDARVLIAVKKASAASSGAAQKQPVREDAPRDQLAALRKQYQEVFGKRPFHGWDEATITEKLAEAKD